MAAAPATKRMRLNFTPIFFPPENKSESYNRYSELSAYSLLMPHAGYHDGLSYGLSAEQSGFLPSAAFQKLTYRLFYSFCIEFEAYKSGFACLVVHADTEIE